MQKSSSYWFITFHYRKVAIGKAHERFGNEAIDMHPADWIYKMNRDHTEYFALIQALPIDKDRFDLFNQKKQHLQKGTRSIRRPNSARPTF